jgi:hypothetical protein
MNQMGELKLGLIIRIYYECLQNKKMFFSFDGWMMGCLPHPSKNTSTAEQSSKKIHLPSMLPSPYQKAF